MRCGECSGRVHKKCSDPNRWAREKMEEWKCEGCRSGREDGEAMKGESRESLPGGKLTSVVE